MINGLAQSNVLVDRKILSELAMFEPYSFRALTKVVEKSGVKSSRLGDARMIVEKKSVYDAQT
jgi:hypothetical protein